MHPFIAPDESFLIFDSDTRKTTGDCRLFISFRRTDDTWTNPVGLGDYITQGAVIARVTPDGKYLFFSNRNGAWWISG